MKYSAVLAGLAGVGLAATGSSSTNPCAVLAASAASQAADNSSGACPTNIMTPQIADCITARSLFKPSLVYSCLQDVPMNKTLAVAQIDWIQQYLPFQSTLSYLAKPPSSYPLPAVDLVGGLNNIREKADTGAYKNEYDFEYDIFNLFQQSYEGHLSFTPLLIGSFQFVRHVSLVSVSENGTDLPKVYFLCQYPTLSVRLSCTDI
jgi:hypothetical protein